MSTVSDIVAKAALKPKGRKRLYKALILVLGYVAAKGLIDGETSALIEALGALGLGIAHKNVNDE